jgi:plasmid stabilization system protein ParE
MTVSRTLTGLSDLASLHTYIRNDNPTAADATLERILSGIAALSRHPEMGKRGRVAATRELVIPPFGIAYRLRRGAVEILAIIHGAQRWPDSF